MKCDGSRLCPVDRLAKRQWVRAAAFAAAMSVAGILAIPHRPSAAGDWPQLLGPQRDGRAVDEELMDQFPAGGPKIVWQAELGSGFSGAAIAGDRVIAFHRVGDRERIEALDERSGKSIWSRDFPATYRGTINPDSGPRTTPVIHGDAVLAYGAAGELHCVALKDGAVRWSRSLLADYDGDEGYFGAGSTPIVMGDRVLINVGGRPNAGLVALNIADGKTIWTATGEQASYSSPTVLKIAGRDHALFITRLSAMAVDPATGRVAFQFPFGQRGPTVNAAAPLAFDDSFFLTASYGIGARRVSFKATAAEGQKPNEASSADDSKSTISVETKTVWSNDESLSSQYTTPVLVDGHLFGTHGREDVGGAAFRCVNAMTGEVRWSKDDLGVAHVLAAGDKLIVLGIDGRLYVAPASPKEFAPLGSWQMADGLCRAVPSLAHGRLYVRTNATRSSQLICLEVGKR